MHLLTADYGGGILQTMVSGIPISSYDTICYIMPYYTVPYSTVYYSIFYMWSLGPQGSAASQLHTSQGFSCWMSVGFVPWPLFCILV